MKQSLYPGVGDCLVVLSAMLIGFFVNGTVRLSGLYFVAFQERYNTGREMASIPFVVAQTIRNCASPITGYLATKFGARPIILAGCLCGAFGVGACFFAQDIHSVIVFFGGFYGLGFGMTSLLVHQVLSEHFSHHFDKVAGMYLCSISMAGILIPMLGDHATKTYGLSGSYLIICAAFLHTVPAAMVLKAAKANLTEQKGIEHTTETSKDEIVAHSLKSSVSIMIENNKNQSSVIKSNEVSFQLMSMLTENNKDSLQSSKAKKEGFVPSFDANQCSENIAAKKPNTSFQTNVKEETKNIHQTSEISNKTSASHAFSLFLDPSYLLILLTQGANLYIHVLLWTVIVDASRDSGVKEHNDLHILQGLYIFEFLGRLLLGYITDSGYISKINFVSSCYVLYGVGFMAFPWLDGFEMVLVVVCFYGLLSGFVATGGVGIAKKYVPKEKSAMGFAALYSLYGLLSFTQPPLIGFFRENLQSYDGIFYLLGTICILCGILTLLIPMAAERYRNKSTLK